jgi:hypothetical protein
LPLLRCWKVEKKSFVHKDLVCGKCTVAYEKAELFDPDKTAANLGEILVEQASGKDFKYKLEFDFKHPG